MYNIHQTVCNIKYLFKSLICVSCQNKVKKYITLKADKHLWDSIQPAYAWTVRCHAGGQRWRSDAHPPFVLAGSDMTQRSVCRNEVCSP